MKNLSQFFEDKQEGIKTVFFDVFDTIISRNVHPEYVKKIWAKRIGIIFNLNITYEQTYKIRNKLEADICKINEENGSDLEFNYNEFTSQFYNEIIKEDKKLEDISCEEFSDICAKIEIEVEKSIQEIDKDWLEFVQTIKKKGITIICVSDFYLTKDMLVQLFEYHGILKYIDKVFVSSEYLLTKRSGRLYDMVLDKVNVSSQKVLMVGDNENSDYNMAKEKGIKAYLVDRKSERKYYKEFMKQVSDQNFIESKLLKLDSIYRNKDSYFEQIGFSLFYFIEKLHTTLLKKGAKNVFFLSREGEYLIRLFELYQKYQGFTGLQYINAHYFLVSRKSTFLPSLKTLSEENFEILFRQYRNISIYDFLSSLNFEQNDMDEISRMIQMNLHNKEDEFPTSIAFEKLINCDLFKVIYEKSRIEQNKNFNKYLDLFEVDVNKEGLNIVDVGWKGTIQDNIFRILDKQVAVNGYYLGLVAAGDAKEGNNKEGLIFSGVPYKSQYYDIYNENRALFEIILGASHGSANKYIDKGDFIDVETKHQDEELKLFKEVIQPLQVKIEVLFIKICNVLCKRHFEENDFEYIFARIHAKMIFFPNKKQLKFFNDMYHFENFGVFEFTKFNKKQKVSINQRIINAVKLITKPRQTLESGFWTPVTLENLGLGFLKYMYGIYRYYNTIIKGTDKGKTISSNFYNQTYKKTKKITNMIEERDKVIKKMTTMIDDRDEAIKSMTKMIDERDAYIKELEEFKRQHVND